MKTLVVGASGATGRLLVQQLLEGGHAVTVVVRSRDRLPGALRDHPQLTVIQAGVTRLADAEMHELVGGCDAVASCLGHTLGVRGIFGPPYRLVADTTRRLCSAIRTTRPEKPVRFVLMGTAGVRNPDLNERISFGQRSVIWLLRLLVPPHADNEQAADHLRTGIGRSDLAVTWAVIRPDSLISADSVSEYEVHPSPTRSALFNAGTTSRINVAHFMARLMTDESTWKTWQGQMPVIYNSAS